MWLMPSKKLWGSDEALVTTPTRNYTLNDLDDYFTDINYPIGKKIYSRILDTKTWELNAPNVKTYPLYGVKVDTPKLY